MIDFELFPFVVTFTCGIFFMMIALYYNFFNTQKITQEEYINHVYLEDEGRNHGVNVECVDQKTGDIILTKFKKNYSK